MEALKEFIAQEGAEKYAESVSLSEKESQNDPETDPFKSKYKARELLHEIKNRIDQLRLEHDGGDCLSYWTAAIDCKLGINYIDTEERSTGQEHLEKCISALEDKQMEEKACNILQIAYNQMGILWSLRKTPEKAHDFLKKADDLYNTYRRDIGCSPWSFDDFFTQDAQDDLGTVMKRRSDSFEEAFTHTIYYIAQVYGSLEQPEKSAEYCHLTLRRQLENKKYECTDWALNAATLSQYYLSQSNYTLSRHCLASAQKIMKELGEPNLKVEINQSDSQTDVTAKEKVPRAWADVYRCLAKYGSNLLDSSIEAIAEEAENNEPANHNSEQKAEQNTETGNESEGQGNPEKNPMFFDLELTSYEEEITDKLVTNFEEARNIFLSVQRWLNIAKEFYVLDGHCTDYVEIIQDHSKAFKRLAFFEPDLDRQCKMHKRRIDMLQEVLKNLNSQFYLLICRQLMYEIAETYSAMMDVKLAILTQNDQRPTPHQVKKVNALVAQSIAKYEEFLDSLRNKADNALPSTYEHEYERSALVAHFCLGRLQSKQLEPDSRKRIENMGKSLAYYKYVADYCKRNPDAIIGSQSEYEICEEMSVLLPVRIEKLRAESA